jgi:hypothetical protein
MMIARRWRATGRRSVLSAWAALGLLIGCAGHDDNADRAYAKQSLETEDQAVASPIDASPVFEPDPPAPPMTEPPPPLEPLAKIEQWLDYLGKEKALVVRATVDDMVGLQRTVPLALRWDHGTKQETHIVTRMTLTVVETLCGPVEPGMLEATYFGGVLATGEGLGSELTPKLEVAAEYIFILRQEQGEYWLQTGDGDTLRQSTDDSEGFYRWGNVVIDLDGLKGVCP